MRLQRRNEKREQHKTLDGGFASKACCGSSHWLEKESTAYTFQSVESLLGLFSFQLPTKMNFLTPNRRRKKPSADKLRVAYAGTFESLLLRTESI